MHRDPGRTRDRLLKAAFAEIYDSGFQAASLEMILASAEVTKGALYHHFPSKAAMGYAVVDEVIRGFMEKQWRDPLQRSDDPIDALTGIMKWLATTITPEQLCRGCPVNNLAQEMSGVDEGFRSRINGLVDDWRQWVAEALVRGQRAGFVREDIQARKTADFLVASFEGIAGMAKNAQDRDLLVGTLESLCSYIESLRPTPAVAGKTE